MPPSATLRTIALTYDSSNPDASARALIYALNPDWKTSDGEVEFVRFKDGITNTVPQLTFGLQSFQMVN